jgi:hypothetical protein
MIHCVMLVSLVDMLCYLFLVLLGMYNLLIWFTVIFVPLLYLVFLAISITWLFSMIALITRGPFRCARVWHLLHPLTSMLTCPRNLVAPSGVSNVTMVESSTTALSCSLTVSNFIYHVPTSPPQWQGQAHNSHHTKCHALHVRNKTLTLIEREDDTRSWSNFLVYFSHNAMPT